MTCVTGKDVQCTEKSINQGVKEFHMLARIGCYCKIVVFSPFKVKAICYHSSKDNK